MNKFELKILDCIPEEGRVENFYKLVEEGYCLYDEFCDEMNKSGNQKKAVKKLESIIALLAEGHKNPKLKPLTGRIEKKDPYIDYEIKVDQLRVYLFQDDVGKIIVLGELKKDTKTQNKNIQNMRAIKLAYFEEKKLKEEAKNTEKIEIAIDNPEQLKEINKTTENSEIIEPKENNNPEEETI